MENSLVLIANILPRPPWRYLFTDTGRNPGSATHKERQAAKGMAVPKASAAKKFRRQIDSAPPVSRQNNALNSVINKC